MGICNGAQILVEAGVVTGFESSAIDLALAPNRMPDRSGYFCSWVRLKRGPASCLFTEFMKDLDAAGGTLPVPMAHGEGRFVTASNETHRRLAKGDGVALVYATADGGTASMFPDNPNDSMFAIAGVTNPGGNVLALMPHPERASWMHQVPVGVGGAWARRRIDLAPGALFSAGPGRGFFEALAEVLSS
jgi:phosphoribosylformylglycinamidine (FGAM) synthase-like amidotransferase family enzyme